MVRASKRATVPARGDYYPTVRAWCQRLGATALDVRANEVRLDERGCRIYVAAVMGPRFDLRVRRLPSSVGRGGADYIVLDRYTLDKRGMSLGTVLHECAHALQLTRLRERRAVRRETRLRTKRYQPSVAIARDHSSHGEPFCRTYVKLLKAALC
jgi:hypothetical protein